MRPFHLNISFEAKETVTNHRKAPSGIRCFRKCQMPVSTLPRYGGRRLKLKSSDHLRTATKLKLELEALWLVPDELIRGGLCINTWHLILSIWLLLPAPCLVVRVIDIRARKHH